MATTDNKIINGSGLSKLSSQIKSYVNDKTEISVGATAPTDNKIKLWVDTSATGGIAWDDITGKPDLATKSEVQQVEDKIPAPYTLPKATTSTLGGVMPDGNTITITDGVISAVGSGGGEPDAYIKDASVSGNTLTLTKKDNTNVVFTPSGGSSGGSGVSGYAFTSSETFTDEQKLHLKEAYLNRNIHITIDSLTVIRIFSMGSKMAYVVINTNGATSNQVLVYTVNRDSSGNITSDTFALFLSYYLVGNSSALSGDIITSENWSQYISASGGDWQYTSSSGDSNLYNAKEMVLYWQDNGNTKHQSYLNFTANFNFETGQTLGTGWTSQEICLDSDDTRGHPSITYDGSSITTSNCVIFYILYKT